MIVACAASLRDGVKVSKWTHARRKIYWQLKENNSRCLCWCPTIYALVEEGHSLNPGSSRIGKQMDKCDIFKMEEETSGVPIISLRKSEQLHMCYGFSKDYFLQTYFR